MVPTSSSVGPLSGRRIAVANWRDLGHRLAGGSEVYAWHAATALAEAGAEVVFVTARDGAQPRREVLDGVEVLRGGGAFGYYAHAAWQLLRRRRRLDLVVDPECGVPSFSPCWVRRSTPVVMVMHHVHQDQFDTYFPLPLARVGQLLERVVTPWLYRRARTVAVSESTRDDMRARLGWTGPVEILRNGTDLPEDLGPGRPQADPDRLLVLGRLVPHKRVDLVVRAVAALASERPGLRLDVAGKGPERERLEALARDLGLGDRVVFHGYVDDDQKAALLQRAGLHVCASDVEGWGQVVVEAAGHGVPTVARDVPGLRESIRDDVTGWLLPEPAAAGPDGDALASDLADGLRRALDELARPGRREATARSCRAWAAGFSWQAMRAQVVELAVEELASAGRSTRTARSHRLHLHATGAAGSTTHPAGTRRPQPVRTSTSGRTER